MQVNLAPRGLAFQIAFGKHFGQHVAVDIAARQHDRDPLAGEPATFL